MYEFLLVAVSEFDRNWTVEGCKVGRKRCRKFHGRPADFGLWSYAYGARSYAYEMVHRWKTGRWYEPYAWGIRRLAEPYAYGVRSYAYGVGEMKFLTWKALCWYVYGGWDTCIICVWGKPYAYGWLLGCPEMCVWLLCVLSHTRMSMGHTRMGRSCVFLAVCRAGFAIPVELWN